MRTLPLFADSALTSVQIESSLIRLFDEYVQRRIEVGSTYRSRRPWRPGTEAVYRSVWCSFARYCAERGMELDQVDEDALHHYLSLRAHHEALSPAHIRRTLQLFRWLFRFEAQRTHRSANTSAESLLNRPEIKFALTDIEEPLPEFLTAAESRRLINFLSSLTLKSIEAAENPAMAWMELRNRAAVALCLGGGVKPGEIRSLKLDDVTIEEGKMAGIPWRLTIPASGNCPQRQSPLASWAGRVLALWLKGRSFLKIPGDWLLPSTLSGKQWSKRALVMAFESVMSDAGFIHKGSAANKLRHTFALRQLADGKKVDDVQRWLGFQDPDSMIKYSRVLQKPVDVI